jgi:hypothetical protein
MSDWIAEALRGDDEPQWQDRPFADHESDPAERLWGSVDSIRKVYSAPLGDSLGRLRDATGMGAAEADAHLTEFAVAFHDAGIEPGEAGVIHSLVAGHTVAEPDAEQIERWATESRRMLRERFPDDADRRMEAARQFVRERPKLARALQASGIGSHPYLIGALAERAMRLKSPRKRR